MRYFGVRTTAVATQGSGMAAAATELSRTASATVFTECCRELELRGKTGQSDPFMDRARVVTCDRYDSNLITFPPRSLL